MCENREVCVTATQRIMDTLKPTQVVVIKPLGNSIAVVNTAIQPSSSHQAAIQSGNDLRRFCSKIDIICFYF